MYNLKVVETQNSRVITTSQLAVLYGTETKTLSNNFNRNRNKYQEGKHYFRLQGSEKMAFLNLHQIDDGSRNAKIVYLWTEKGALLHAKSLNTDKAWEVYDKLVDLYFKVNEIIHRDSYMIDDPIERARVWIEEQELHRLKLHEVKQDIKINQTELRRLVSKFIDKISSKRSKVSGDSDVYKKAKDKFFKEFGIDCWGDIARVDYKRVEKAIETFKM